MSQADVYILLKSKPNKWLSVEDLSNKLQCSKGSISANMPKVKKLNNIQTKTKKLSCGNSYKRGINVYRYFIT